MDVSVAGIQETLERFDFKFSLVERSESLPFDQIYVFLGRDEKGNDWVLNLRLFEQEMPRPEGREMAGPEKMVFLNFFLHLPFLVQERRVAEICRLTCVLNKILPMHGFGVGEVDRTVFFQYTYPIIDGQMDVDSFLGIMGILVHTVSSHLGTFEPVARGLKGFDQVLGDAREYVTANVESSDETGE